MLTADKGPTLRPNMIGSGFWVLKASSTMMRLRLLAACRASAGAPGSVQGGLRQTRAGREHDLAEAAQLEVLGDVQGLRQGYQHALIALQVIAGRDRKQSPSTGATLPTPHC